MTDEQHTPDSPPAAAPQAPPPTPVTVTNPNGTRWTGRKAPMSPEALAASAKIAGAPTPPPLRPGEVPGAWPARVPVAAKPVDPKVTEWFSKHSVG
jgi:hypothetical protein